MSWSGAVSSTLLKSTVLALLIFAVGAGRADAAEARIKDLVNIRGVRANFVNGLGLVVGLKATGDSKKSLATNRAVANMLTRMGMNTRADDVVAGNMAVVMVTGELPPFARIGDRLDIKVSAVGDAKSLAGGTLILTPMRAGDSEIYAVAQGAVVVGQASGSGPQVLTVARVPQGATVEREFLPVIGGDGNITLSLQQADFTTATNIAEAINAKFRGFFAEARDVASVQVSIPHQYRDRVVEFISMLETIPVQSDAKAVVILNERTGTIVVGSAVVLAPVAVSHGELSIRIEDKNAKGGGKKDAKTGTVAAMGGTTVGELVESLNALGVKPADLVGILQSLHAAGALKAELQFL